MSLFTGTTPTNLVLKIGETKYSVHRDRLVDHSSVLRNLLSSTNHEGVFDLGAHCHVGGLPKGILHCLKKIYSDFSVNITRPDSIPTSDIAAAVACADFFDISEALKSFRPALETRLKEQLSEVLTNIRCDGISSEPVLCCVTSVLSSVTLNEKIMNLLPVPIFLDLIARKDDGSVSYSDRSLQQRYIDMIEEVRIPPIKPYSKKDCGMLDQQKQSYSSGTRIDPRRHQLWINSQILSMAFSSESAHLAFPLSVYRSYAAAMSRAGLHFSTGEKKGFLTAVLRHPDISSECLLMIISLQPVLAAEQIAELREVIIANFAKLSGDERLLSKLDQLSNGIRFDLVTGILDRIQNRSDMMVCAMCLLCYVDFQCKVSSVLLQNLLSCKEISESCKLRLFHHHPSAELLKFWCSQPILLKMSTLRELGRVRCESLLNATPMQEFPEIVARYIASNLVALLQAENSALQDWIIGMESERAKAFLKMCFAILAKEQCEVKSRVTVLVSLKDILSARTLGAYWDLLDLKLLPLEERVVLTEEDGLPISLFRSIVSSALKELVASYESKSVPETQSPYGLPSSLVQPSGAESPDSRSLSDLSRTASLTKWQAEINQRHSVVPVDDFSQVTVTREMSDSLRLLRNAKGLLCEICYTKGSAVPTNVELRYRA